MPSPARPASGPSRLALVAFVAATALSALALAPALGEHGNAGDGPSVPRLVDASLLSQPVEADDCALDAPPLGSPSNPEPPPAATPTERSPEPSAVSTPTVGLAATNLGKGCFEPIGVLGGALAREPTEGPALGVVGH